MGDPPFDLRDPRKAPLLQFDRGGYLPPGVSMALNKTGRPEPIFTAGQWDRLAAIVDRQVPGQSGALVNVERWETAPAQSPHAIAEELHWVLKGRG